jgi:hypothetical protein
MTGGAGGRCNPTTAATVTAYAGGYGYDRGLGLRRGYGRGYGGYPPAAGPAYSMDATGEMDMLKADADYLQKSLDAINKRIDELSVKPAEAS